VVARNSLRAIFSVRAIPRARMALRAARKWHESTKEEFLCIPHEDRTKGEKAGVKFLCSLLAVFERQLLLLCKRKIVAPPGRLVLRALRALVPQRAHENRTKARKKNFCAPRTKTARRGKKVGVKFSCSLRAAFVRPLYFKVVACLTWSQHNSGQRIATRSRC